MKSFFKFFFFLILSLSFNSCATLFNSKVTDVVVIPNRPCDITIESDDARKIATDHNKILIASVRKNEPLVLTLVTDSITKTISIKSRSSLFFWMNLTGNYG